MRNFVAVWWDGVCLWTDQLQAHQDSYDLVSLGANAQGFSSTGQVFAGIFEPEPYLSREATEFIRKNLIINFQQTSNPR